MAETTRTIRSSSPSPEVDSEALARLDDLLKCPVCRQTLADPKTLSCLHSFCKVCLDRQEAKVCQETNKATIQCPTCTLPAVVPDGGTACFTTASHLSGLSRLRDKLTAITHSRHTTVCRAHNKPLEVYCESCEELACVKCTLRKHKDHTCSIVDDVYEQHKRKIEVSLIPMREKVESLEAASQSFGLQSSAITEQGRSVKEELRTTIQRLVSSLQEAEKELSGTVDTTTEQKLKMLCWQKGEVDAVLVKLKSCKEFVEEELQIGSHPQLVATEKDLVSEMDALMLEAQSKKFTPIEEPNMSFVKGEAVTSASSNIGKIEYSYQYLAERCKATGRALAYSMVAFQTSFELSFTSDDGVSLSFPTSLISCKLSYHYYNFIKKCPCNVTEIRPGTYRVTYTPVSRGPHELSVLVGGVHLLGSPYKVQVLPHPEMRKKPIKIIDGLNGPYAIGLTKSGSIVLSEWDKHCVSVVSSEGDKFATYGKKGSDSLQFNCPAGLIVTQDNHVLVADVYNHRIQKFTVRGTFVAAAGGCGKGNLQFNRPSWVAVHPKTQQVYVSDTLNHRVQILNPNLTFYRSFGRKGTSPGELQHPAGIAFNTRGSVFIVDGTNHRIQNFTPEGDLLCEFGQSHLQLPSGICSDDCDVLYVADSRAHAVVCFASDGTFLGNFGNDGLKPGLFDQPHGVFVDYTGALFVADSVQGRVIVC